MAMFACLDPQSQNCMTMGASKLSGLASRTDSLKSLAYISAPHSWQNLESSSLRKRHSRHNPDDLALALKLLGQKEFELVRFFNFKTDTANQSAGKPVSISTIGLDRQLDFDSKLVGFPQLGLDLNPHRQFTELH